MKAIVFEKYGSPEVLQLKEIEKPAPKGDEVLIRVKAASANPLDWHVMRGAPFLVRLEMGFTKPKKIRLGADLAGVIEVVGMEVSHFKVGDPVFGEVSSSNLGSFAEYVCAKEDTIEKLPQGVSFEEAAAVPIAGVTALQGLRFGKIKKGDQVLINGASGGVGTYAVQIAKSHDTRVTAVCSGLNKELVKSLGADQVIDYTKVDFTESGKYDLIFDMVGNRTISELKRALIVDGRCSMGGFTSMGLLFNQMLMGAWETKTSKRFMASMGSAKVNRKDLAVLGELMGKGKMKSIIDKEFPLEETAEAIRYLETMRARGKVVIQVN